MCIRDSPPVGKPLVYPAKQGRDGRPDLLRVGGGPVQDHFQMPTGALGVPGQEGFGWLLAGGQQQKRQYYNEVRAFHGGEVFIHGPAKVRLFYAPPPMG